MEHKFRKRFFSAILHEEQNTLDLMRSIKELFDVPVSPIHDMEEFVRLNAKDIILEEGVSSITSYSMMYCEFLPPNQPISGLIGMLKAMLEKLDAQKSLTIIDRYLFPTGHDQDYIDTLLLVVSSSLPTNGLLRLVVGARSNKTLLQEFTEKLSKMNPSVDLEIIYTDEYHDRFWISDGKSGLFVGTSLNGIGKKYSIVDDLSGQDAQEIYKSLNL